MLKFSEKFYRKIWYQDLEKTVNESLPVGGWEVNSDGFYGNYSVILCEGIGDYASWEDYSGSQEIDWEDLTTEDVLHHLYWAGLVPAGNYFIHIWW